MKRDNVFLLLSVVLFAAVSLTGCGGGGSSSALAILGAGSATVSGTVTGTSVIAVDENGDVAASCVATGSPPAFTLTLPAGHSYRFFFVQEEGTPAQRAYLLHDGTTTAFSFLPGKTYYFGAVTMDPGTGKATPGTGLVAQAGVTVSGTDTTRPPFFSRPIYNSVGWKFLPEQGKQYLYDGVTGGGAYENRISWGGTETIASGIYGNVSTTKVQQDAYWKSNGSLWHSVTNWIAFVDGKLVVFRERENGTTWNGSAAWLDFPLIEGKSWRIAYLGETFEVTVKDTADHVILPGGGDIGGVVRVAFVPASGETHTLYFHPDYPYNVKWVSSDGESEVLREIITSGGGDTTPPALISSIPTTGATGLPTNLAGILFEFSEPMGSGSSVTWTGVDNSYFSPFGWSPDNTWGAVSLIKALPADTTIGWTLHGGLQPGYFSDMAGNPLPTTSGSFRTSSGPDTTPPTLVSSNPANGATGVSTSLPSIAYTFSEAIVGHSVTWTGIDNSFHSTPVWSADRKTITFPLVKALSAGATVSWTLNNPAYGQPMRDLAGNTLPATSGSFTTSSAGAFAQADLTGTWDLYQFQTSTQTPGGGWFRLVVRFDANGNMIIDDNTTWETTTPDSAPPNGPVGFVWTVNTAGTITETGDPASPTFHGNMASNKHLIVATVTLSPTDRAIRILRKRVPGVTYSNADLFNKSFTFQALSSGTTPQWIRGDGSIDATGVETLANVFFSTGQHLTNIQEGNTFSVSPEGVVRSSIAPDFKGFLTPDKKILIGTERDGATNFGLIIFTISGQTFSQSDFAGLWNWTQFNCGAGSEWGYGTVTSDAIGNVTATPLGTSGTGPLTPWSGTVSLSPSGIMTDGSDPTFQGVMSYNKDIVFFTDTGETGGVFDLSILMR